ncbi:hypothetical protein [Gracilibacillus thailandensis]|uniref:Uncharacterized protein n=1 Tax=Gracilibacillus thailandensis TaxID=563735 RepID=A0A6N7QZV5_9BACI|nr:hypothetical protein [Gracilibacillus thailandensis]MRI67608.1 hypothetical protein [Gracilibacillus thailandensis]
MGNSVYASDSETSQNLEVDVDSAWEDFDNGNSPKVEEGIISSREDEPGEISTQAFKTLATGKVSLSRSSNEITATATTTRKSALVSLSATVSMRIPGMSPIDGSTDKSYMFGKAESSVSTETSHDQVYEAIGIHTASDHTGIYELRTWNAG